jgi:hypothetical protein
MVLQADLVALRDSAGYGSNGIAPPRFFFDPKAEKITAFIVVDGSLLAKEPSGIVRDNLSRTAEAVFTDFKISMPELSEREFVVEFRNLSGSSPVEFADYKDGKLVLH